MNENKIHNIIMYLTFFSLGIVVTALMITQGFFQEFIYVMLLGLIFLMISVAYHWVRGIDHMQENHPDYKGEDLFDEGETESKL